MVKPLLFCSLFVFAGLSGGASAARAQGGGISLAFAGGKTVGAGGEYVERGGIAFMASVFGHVRGLPFGLSTLGIDGSVQGNPDSGFDDCLIGPGQTGCLVRFPMSVGLALQGGWQIGRPASPWSLEPRLGLGPSWLDEENGAVLGTHAQIGVARRLGAHWALELNGRATVFPSVRSRTVALASLVLGVRWCSGK